MIAALVVGALVVLAVGLVPLGSRSRFDRIARGMRDAAAVAGRRSGEDGQVAPRSSASRSRGGSLGARSPVDALVFDLELAAICLRTGLPPVDAFGLAGRAGATSAGLRTVARSLQVGSFHSTDPSLQAVWTLVGFSQDTGVALAPLVSSLAGDLAREEKRRRQVAAARLGVKLVIPLGVCTLPAFVLMGVVPVVVVLLGDMSSFFAR